MQPVARIAPCIAPRSRDPTPCFAAMSGRRERAEAAAEPATIYATLVEIEGDTESFPLIWARRNGN